MVYLARVAGLERESYWVLFDEKVLLRGWRGESRTKLYRRWERKCGEQITNVTRYIGTLSLAELACNRSNLAMPQINARKAKQEER